MYYNRMDNTTIINDEKGIVLVISLLLLSAMALLMVVSVMATTTDTMIGANYKNSIKAFYDAEAGVQYTLSRIEEGLVNETISLPDPNTSLNLSHVVPTGFSFDSNITITYINHTRFRFRSTGHSGNSKCTLEVDFIRDFYPGPQYGVFGSSGVELQSNANMFSYNSNIDPNAPLDPNNSLGNADLGSNGLVEVHNSIIVDGDIELGDDGLGTEGVYKPTGTPIVTGTPGIDVARVDPDPLDAVNMVSSFAITNDNTNNSAIVGDVINVTGGGSTVTLTAGNYYLTSIMVGNGATLNIDASAGPVNIYLHGDIDAKNGSAINITAKPTDFKIYCDTTDILSFKNSSGFKGLVYAPFAQVYMHNSSYVHGLIWADNVEMKYNTEFWYDEALKDFFSTYATNVDPSSWREIQVL